MSWSHVTKQYIGVKVSTWPHERLWKNRFPFGFTFAFQFTFTQRPRDYVANVRHLGLYAAAITRCPAKRQKPCTRRRCCRRNYSRLESILVHLDSIHLRFVSTRIRFDTFALFFLTRTSTRRHQQAYSGSRYCDVHSSNTVSYWPSNLCCFVLFRVGLNSFF